MQETEDNEEQYKMSCVPKKYHMHFSTMNNCLFFVFALVAVTLAQSDSCTSDQYQVITQCYTTYFAGYNITMTDTIPEYWDFHGVRKQMLEDDGLHVQPYICQLANTLVSCLAPYQCMGPNAYTQMNAANATEAQDYWIDLAVSGYQCGAGYNYTMTEFYCMAFCRDRYGADLDACDNQVNIDVANGMNVCTATQKDMDCNAKIYTNCCDSNAGAYSCNVDLAANNAVDPTCSNAGMLSCPQPK